MKYEAMKYAGKRKQELHHGKCNHQEEEWVRATHFHVYKRYKCFRQHFGGKPVFKTNLF